MAEAKMRTILCDAPGCKSSCTLLPTVKDSAVASELNKRGWQQSGTCDTAPDPKHYCPAHIPVLMNAEGLD